MLECAFLKQKVLIIIVNMNHRSLGKNYNAGHHGNSRIEYNLLYFIFYNNNARVINSPMCNYYCIL